MHRAVVQESDLRAARKAPEAGAAGLGLAVLAGTGIVLLARGSRARARQLHRAEARRSEVPGVASAVRAARRLNCAAGILAFSVLADSGLEHYRGSFSNPAMYTPLAVSSATLAMSAHGLADARSGFHRLRNFVYSAAALTGLAGTGFHLYNVLKRPGRLDWQNLFYGAPLGAPGAILLSGLLGFMSERIRDAKPGRPLRLFSFPAGRLTAAITSIGLLGAAAEAGMLHYRGAYHDPFMFVPVTVPPVAAALMGELALTSRPRNRWLSLFWLRLTAAIGLVGAGFHAYGVHRNMGGWRNWRQNILAGPPLPAPPSFSGLALAGLAALALTEEHPDA